MHLSMTFFYHFRLKFGPILNFQCIGNEGFCFVVFEMPQNFMTEFLEMHFFFCIVMVLIHFQNFQLIGSDRPCIMAKSIQNLN